MQKPSSSIILFTTPGKVNNGKPDERTTLFWNPYVKTDPNGNTTIEFYTNDTDQVDYDIDIEGLDLQEPHIVIDKKL